MKKFKCNKCGATSSFEEVNAVNKVIYGVVEDIETLIEEDILFDHMQWCPNCNREIMPENYEIVEE